MPTGERMKGFTYLWLLFVLAAGASGLALAGQRWSTAVQREQERELIFRGQQIAAAIAAYQAASPPDKPAWPRSLQALVKDDRTATAKHHLRQLYSDPVTGEPDWVLVLGEDGSLRGVRSRSERRALISVGQAPAKPGLPVKLSDRSFLAQPRAAPAASHAASAASSAAAEPPPYEPIDVPEPPP